MLRRASLALAAVLVGVASAHDFWIEPSAWRIAPGESLDVRLFVGDGFPGKVVERKEDRIVKLVAATDGEVTDLAALEGKLDPVGRFRPEDSGWCVLGFESTSAEIELEPEKFESYLGHEGLERIVRERRRRGESGAPGRERYARCSKALVAVGEPGAWEPPKPLGLTLELELLSDPRTVFAKGADAPEPLVVRLLRDGKPIEGVYIDCVPQRPLRKAEHAHAHDADGEHVHDHTHEHAEEDLPEGQRTDAKGIARFELTEAGPWLLAAVDMVRIEDEESAFDWQSHWASLGFEAR